MQNLNSQTERFLKDLTMARASARESVTGETVMISKVASTLAVVYETARNAVEFKAEHLIRQEAINRILKRRLFLNQTSKRVALLLIKELLWGRYLKEETVPTSKVNELVAIIDRYRLAQEQYSVSDPKGEKDNKFGGWLIGIAACEIEERLFFE